MKIVKRPNKIRRAGSRGISLLRVYHRKEHGRGCARYLIKCGCCEESIEVHYGDGILEIGGVLGSAEDWWEILHPLLEAEKKRPDPRTGT